MRITTIPAQVTTVEDRIVGNLGFSQVLLLIVPVFISAGLFALLPPFMENSLYKYLLMGLATITCCVLALRVKGRILASWLVTIFRYNIRPKYYLFNKNTTSLRPDYPPLKQQPEESQDPLKDIKQVRRPRLSIQETASVISAMDNPAVNIRFETTKKGYLNVRLTEVEE